MSLQISPFSVASSFLTLSLAGITSGAVLGGLDTPVTNTKNTDSSSTTKDSSNTETSNNDDASDDNTDKSLKTSNTESNDDTATARGSSQETDQCNLQCTLKNSELLDTTMITVTVKASRNSQSSQPTGAQTTTVTESATEPVSTSQTVQVTKVTKTYLETQTTQIVETILGDQTQQQDSTVEVEVQTRTSTLTVAVAETTLVTQTLLYVGGIQSQQVTTVTLQAASEASRISEDLDKSSSKGIQTTTIWWTPSAETLLQDGTTVTVSEGSFAVTPVTQNESTTVWWVPTTEVGTSIVTASGYSRSTSSANSNLASTSTRSGNSRATITTTDSKGSSIVWIATTGTGFSYQDPLASHSSVSTRSTSGGVRSRGLDFADKDLAWKKTLLISGLLSISLFLNIL